MLSLKNCSIFLLVITLVSPLPVFSEDNSRADGAVYFVAQIDIKDHQEYREKYARTVARQLVKAGAEILVASRDKTTLEGDWSGNWTVISKFPSAEAANDWYNSAEYATFRKMRQTKLTKGGNIAIFPALNTTNNNSSKQKR